MTDRPPSPSEPVRPAAQPALDREAVQRRARTILDASQEWRFVRWKPVARKMARGALAYEAELSAMQERAEWEMKFHRAEHLDRWAAERRGEALEAQLAEARELMAGLIAATPKIRNALNFWRVREVREANAWLNARRADDALAASAEAETEADRDEREWREAATRAFFEAETEEPA